MKSKSSGVVQRPAGHRASASLLRGVLESPIGQVTILAHADRPETLTAVVFDGKPFVTSLGEKRGPAAIAPAEPTALLRALARYFDGEVSILDTLAVDAGGTPFQRLVWSELRRIPVGTVISYGELARRIGQPTASRAVAGANAANPVAIVVPCHRVVASDGSLHGYGGGLDRKKWLLDHEARLADPSGFTLRS
jgi:methylated-DNA-[protein]-cysteine S-methyltransferase